MHSLKWHFLQNIDKRYLHCYILSPFVWLRFSRVWTPVINIHRSWLIAVAGDPDNTPIYTSICSVLLVALKRSCSRFVGLYGGWGTVEVDGIDPTLAGIPSCLSVTSAPPVLLTETSSQEHGRSGVTEGKLLDMATPAKCLTIAGTMSVTEVSVEVEVIESFLPEV